MNGNHQLKIMFLIHPLKLIKDLTFWPRISKSLSNQALLAVVSTVIHRDISNLRDILTGIKQFRLRNVSSRIELFGLRTDTRAELSSPSRINLLVTDPLFNGMHGVIEVQNQTLCGSEPIIYCVFEGGNMKLSLFPLGNDLEIQSQNLYGSESSIDRLYRE